MPLFKYECDECGVLSEILIRGSETPVCPECGSKKLVKQASAFAAMAGGSKQEVSAACPTCPGAGACPMAS
jgi:putative FmdB family regulatory protein